MFLLQICVMTSVKSFYQNISHLNILHFLLHICRVKAFCCTFVSFIFFTSSSVTEFLSNIHCPISWIYLINTAHFREIIISLYAVLHADNKVLFPLKKKKLSGIVLGTQWEECFTVQLWWESRPQQMGQKLTVTQRRKTTKSRGENGDIREIHHHPLLLTLCRPWPYQAAGLSEWRHQLVGRAARPDLVWEHEQPRLQQSSW